MKKIILLVITVFFTSCFNGRHIDSNLSEKATAVLRVEAKKQADVCKKYCWQEINILRVFKNKSSYRFAKTVEIAHYSWDDGIPLGLSTIYLEKYNPAKGNQWKLLGGKAQTGVSHFRK